MRSIAAGTQLNVDLRCEFDGDSFSVKSSRDIIVVEVPDLISGMRLLRKFSRLKHLQLDHNKLLDTLRLLGTSVEFRVGEVCIAAAGRRDTSVFGRLLSFKGLRLMPIAALRAAFKGQSLAGHRQLNEKHNSNRKF